MLSNTSFKTKCVIRPFLVKPDFRIALIDNSSGQSIALFHGFKFSVFRINVNQLDHENITVSKFALSTSRVISVPLSVTNKQAVTHWSTRYEGFIRLLQIILDTFSIKSVSWSIDNQVDESTDLLVTDWVANQGLKLSLLKVTGEKMNVGVVHSFLQLFESNPQLELLGRQDITRYFFEDYKFSRLRIQNAEWFQLSWAVHSKTVRLTVRIFDELSLNEFLILWIATESSDMLEHLDLEQTAGIFNIPSVLNGLEAVKMDKESVEDLGIPLIEIKEYYSITQTLNTNKKAILYFAEKRFIFKVVQ
ncbi:hypothetical protein GCK72_003352 [Caenorhabditis remanei]|uniref:F-box associated domain-containing protein n=1 Tax=Caenorhabditis remanei TaxID=31234 RepID=A0A6A5HV51_CAERE|nr:hypothetical protein GCK72_003352 [Caenorhabditis remanei]KAF1771525.1 hypothetical protein GCK72_003352 [Caenorhabditis remanei]